jgi:hypothetical protein
MLNDSLTHPFVLKQPSSLVGRDFIDVVLNFGGSNEGDGKGTSNDVVL